MISAAQAAEPAPDLVVYAYDSFVAKGGLGPEILPLFEKSSSCRARILGSGDGVQVLARLKLDLERKKPGAHVLVGIDQQLWDQAKKLADPSYAPRDVTSLIAESRIGEGFVPFDYGVFAFMSDQTRLKELKLKPPESLADLQKAEWKRNLILQDPRTSTPGLAFVQFVRALKGAQAPEFWRTFRLQWLTLAAGWDAAYGAFLKGQAPLVWSYTTSQAYHEENGDKSLRYQALVFKEGNPLQIEGAFAARAALESAPERTRECARKFLDFLISEQVQKLVPKKSWMLPVRKGVVLPASFERLPKPLKIVALPAREAEVSAALSEWNRSIR